METETPLQSLSISEQGTLSQGQTSSISFSSPSIIDTTQYIVQERMTLINEGFGEPSKQNLWIALIRDIDPYQKVTKRTISPGDYRVVIDEYGNHIAEFDFSEMPPGIEIEVLIDYEISVNNLTYDLSQCVGELPDFFTSPELHIESHNPQIINLASELSAGKQSACDQSRAFYDFIGDKLVYSYNGKNWGAQAALGPMGADCTEYASLMMALSRASGIPARYLEGLYYNPGNGSNLARTEHAWFEVYLPGIGWTPMDPTLGRTSITREDFFAKMTPDHIIVSRGRNPSVLRGSSYFTHIYWPGDSTVIKVKDFEWKISKIE
jgi:transglutaminase-like putative cysteine protease